MRTRFGWLLCLALAAWANPALAGDKAIDVGKGKEIRGELKAEDKINVDGKPMLAKPFLVNLEGDKTYKIALDAGSPDFDPYLIILNKDGKVLAFDDDGGGDLNSLLLFKAPAKATYKVLAGAYDFEPGPFTLKIEPVVRKDAVGKELDVGKGLSLKGALIAGQRELVYRIKMDSGKSYRIDMTGDFDTFLKVLGPDGKLLAEDDDGGEGLNARLVFRAPADATFRIVATSFLGAGTGNFVLEVREE